DTRGQWGGLIVLGDATTNFGGAAQVEGIPSDNGLATYGGENDMDNSGVLSYISIRHGGTQLGAANEINGLTLAGVGSGTTIHHVEVVSNLDDGIEFFGGSVTVDDALVAFCGDDSFDWDQGFHGGGSNWLAIQDQPGAEGDRGGELDGDDSDAGNVSSDEMPFAIPTVEGWTVVGVGGNQGLLLRNGSGGH
ncbi:MAG: multidrug transporter, partial [Flavobacteriales bacterium]